MHARYSANHSYTNFGALRHLTPGVDNRRIRDMQVISANAKPQQEAWQREFRSHTPEYAAEFAGSLFLVFSVVIAVAIMFAPGSPALRFIPSPRLRLFVTGSILGGAGSLVAITPLGRLSGAHLNPAISLGFFAEGKMHLQDLFGYIAAQLGGAVIGVGGSSRRGRFWPIGTRGAQCAREGSFGLGSRRRGGHSNFRSGLRHF